jgi:glycosyltransferase involved in cell wall biosynthesis
VDDVRPPLSVAVVADYAEEGWPSMDLVAELTVDALSTVGPSYAPTLLRPRLPRPAGRIVGARGRNADRAIGRYLAYPRWLRRQGRFDLHHVVDHSYAHLVHALPAERAIVTCHDLDAFRSLLEPEAEPRPAWFRWMMARVLAGLRRAAHVIADSEAVRAELVARGVVPAERVSTVPLPAHPDFRAEPDPEADAALARLAGPAAGTEILHVGSTAPRKAIPRLLRAFAALAEARPEARLLRAGGLLAPEQRALAAELGIGERIVELPFLGRPLLAAAYRRAALVVVPSEREGFGLPVVEAFACGAPVLASALPVLREVGGAAARYVAVGEDWGAALLDEVARLASADGRAGTRRAALARAERHTLARYGEGLAAVYARVLP